MANENPTLYSNFERVKDWAVEKFADKETLAATLSDVAFSGDYGDLLNKPDLTVYPTYAYVYSYVADAINSVDHSEYVTYDFLSNQSYVTSTALDNAAYITNDALNGYATESYVSTAIANLVSTAPETLDTLEELAAALGDDPNFAATMTAELAKKADSAYVYTKDEINAMSYVSQAALSANSYVTAQSLSGMNYITMADVSACAYITMADVSAQAYLTAVPAEYITESELSACGYLTAIPAEYVTESELSGMSYVSQDSLSANAYVTALTQAEMETLFPLASDGE